MTASSVTCIANNCESLIRDTTMILDRCESRMIDLQQKIWEGGLGDTSEKTIGAIKLLMANNWPVGKDYGLFIVHHKFDENSDTLGIKAGATFFHTKEEGTEFIISQKAKVEGRADVIRLLTFVYEDGPVLRKEERV